MRRSVLAGAVFAAALAGLPGCGDASVDCVPGPAVLPYQAAVNAYYLQEEAARSVRRGEPRSAVLDEVFGKLAALGVTLVRTNAYNDDPAKHGDSTIQLSPGRFDETSLRGLDRVLSEARSHGIRLVLPLGNYWDDYGGARAYVAWAGLPAPVQGDPRFFTDPAVRSLYRAYVGALLGRVSTADGLRYAEHPAVFAWELLNEPRGRGLDPQGLQMRAWVDDVAALVKRLAPGHRVSTGEEGFDADREGYDPGFWQDVQSRDLFAGGSSFRRNTASPHIDLASVHLYPEGWRFPRDLFQRGGSRWVGEHAAIARALGKPLLVGEFGLRGDDAAEVPSLAERRGIYRAWLTCAAESGAVAASPWMFSYDTRPAAYDAHTFYFRSGTDPADPVNQYADLLVAEARRAAPAP